MRHFDLTGYVLVDYPAQPGHRAIVHAGSTTAHSITVAILRPDGRVFTSTAASGVEVQPAEFQEYAQHRVDAGFNRSASSYGHHTIAAMRRRNPRARRAA